ncbi:MAG: hypothetical protein AAFW87_10400 [Pseudomonadota bacterium]
MHALQRFDNVLLAMICIVLITTVGIYFYSEEFFWGTYAAEDGLVEYATALFLLVASVVLVKNAISLRSKGLGLAAACTIFYALLFFFAAGEEISWGQRIFGWETGERFKEINKQEETNLHNLKFTLFGVEIHLAKTLFGPILTTILLLYLVFLPLLYPRVGWIKRLADRFAVPVPRRRHAVLAVAASLVIAAIDVSRKWEVYELVFSLLATSIFLIPQNREHTA